MSHLIPTIYNNAVEFMQEESVYIVDDIPTQEEGHVISTDELTDLQNDQLSKNNREHLGCRIKCRKKEGSRWLAEQTIRMRERFYLSSADQLLASCSAALLKRFRLQGRLYVTTHHICFYSNLTKKITGQVLPYTSLAHVEKRRGRLVTNAIKLCFVDEDVPPMFIGSLHNPDKVLSLVQNRLQMLNLIPAGKTLNKGSQTTQISRDVSGNISSLHKNPASAVVPIPHAYTFLSALVFVVVMICFLSAVMVVRVQRLSSTLQQLIASLDN